MESKDYKSITLDHFRWLNEPTNWNLCDSVLKVTTDDKTDFWQGTWYNFHFNTGHLFGIDIKDDFTFEACIEADFASLYDQAGLMLYINEKQWIKTGIEYTDGQAMIGSVLTNGVSDWATGIFNGNPKKFWLKLSSVGNIVCIKYSIDKVKWALLRLCPFIKKEEDLCFVGFMCCTPQRSGLNVKFSEYKITVPIDDVLHGDN
ncbi:regulation of enolase protein 1-like [Colias croceus]|uniref:regulation of enolase protein 1-like n=1 Tax=Colias crocea TaxID=72248 RepID=UPI001E27D989|nr:regulation of enolase protein 1-like [Colias croceus]